MFAARPRDEEIWESVLSRFQADLDEHRRHLELASEGTTGVDLDRVVPVFVPPSNLPALPAAFAEWAAALARETDELVELAKGYLDRNRPTPGVRRLGTPTNSGLASSLIDRKL
jgi:hypothetical protein